VVQTRVHFAPFFGGVTLELARLPTASSGCTSEMGSQETATPPGTKRGATISADTTSGGGRRSTRVLVAGVLAIAVALRFSTLGLQSYWSDEAATVDLLRGSFGHMLSALPDHERTPPLYYAVAWFWSRVFGTGEVGLRSVSAVFGVDTVLVAYLIARHVADERAGLIAGLLCAVSPLLVWYSQEARSYSMLVFLCAASVWLWLRASKSRSRASMVAWGIVSCLAILTHYFGSFIVLFEALFLLRTRRGEPVLLGVVALLAAAQVSLIPLALHQAHANEPNYYVTTTPLSTRIIDIPKRFLLGETGAPTAAALFGFALVILAGAAAWLLMTRANSVARRGAGPLLALAAFATVLPLCLAVIGLDFFAYRYLLATWVLLAVAAAVGLSTRAGLIGSAVAVGLAASLLTLTVTVDLTPKLQRADWAFSPTALKRPHWGRLIMVTPAFEGFPFQLYVPSAKGFFGHRIAVREVDVVEFRNPPGRQVPQLGRGFSRIDRVDHQKLSFIRYIAPRPEVITTKQVRPLAGESQAVLFQPGPA